ncbi:MAG TPA: hypothetical protein VIF62_29685 [Labilithrix sp.]
MRSLFLRLLPLAGLLAIGAACSQTTSDDDVAVGSDQHLTEAKPIPPAIWATCWFESNGSNDPFFLAYTITCSGPDPKYPLPAQVLASGLDSANTQSVNGELDDASEKRLGAVYAQKLPLALDLSIILRPTKDSGFVSELDPDDFRFHQSIDHPETITKDHPLVVTQPFGLWKLEIVQKTSRYVIVPDGAKGLSTAPFVVGFVDQSTYDLTNAPVNNATDGNPVSLMLVAPPDGKLGVRYVSAATDKRVLLDSPGTWVAGDDDLTKQSDVDPGGPPEPAQTDAGPAQDAAPANPPGPAPTCGVADLPCCPGQACGSGTYCKYQQNGAMQCTSCGGPGQDCCPGQTCSDKSYCKYQQSGAMQCTSCGAPGQDCCPGQTCGDASYCKYQPSGAMQCTSCGASGQDCCPGQTCTAGTSCQYQPSGTMMCK